MIDTHSDAYRAGQFSVYALGGLLALFVLWKATGEWRNPGAAGPDDLPRAEGLRRRRTRIVVAAMSALCLAGATGLVIAFHADPSYGAAAASGPADRTVDAPTEVGGYQLITGDAATRLAARIPTGSTHHVWFYTTTPGGTQPQAMLMASTTAWDPELASEKAAHSSAWGLTNFFAGARVDDPQSVDPGSLGGLMQCGRSGANQGVVCAWDDASTSGSLALPATMDLPQAAAVALLFRNHAEH